MCVLDIFYLRKIVLYVLIHSRVVPTHIKKPTDEAIHIQTIKHDTNEGKILNGMNE